MRGVSSGGFCPHHPTERSYGRTLDCLSSRSGFDSRLGRPKVLQRAVQLTTRQLTIFDVWILKKTLRSVLLDFSEEILSEMRAFAKVNGYDFSHGIVVLNL